MLRHAERRSYWILSHTWSDDECPEKGFRKIEGMCNLAKTDGVSHVWIDTCCIDKTSSAELSGSINSMFDWYEGSELCIALQELIPLTDVWFYDISGWNLRDKQKLGRPLSRITRIDYGILDPRYPLQVDLSNVSVAKRMSWVANRKTTRFEDKTYCL
ncbi:hypothetical protein C7999DRAFT_43961 [Corynascus novoguineensis]|uniref:Heterokaryon incompatibility domain-containing protein n=1 Tax=Corynascus novoguineensis TaxID=1126955 RepID=A0AAN7CLR6_9PEZI|nr:hypothetical protein C7999DRAFT_43961 [Corynascus novoguineensis]